MVGIIVFVIVTDGMALVVGLVAFEFFFFGFVPPGTVSEAEVEFPGKGEGEVSFGCAVG